MDGLFGCLGWRIGVECTIFTVLTLTAPLKLTCVPFIIFFHRAICTNQFFHKTGRSDSPNCSFCKNIPESFLHLFCHCEKVSRLWDDLCFLFNNISGESFNFSDFEKMFVISYTSEHDNIISYLFLCPKFYIHRCKFQESDPNFVAFMNLVKTKRTTEYKIAASKGNLVNT